MAVCVTVGCWVCAEQVTKVEATCDSAQGGRKAENAAMKKGRIGVHEGAQGGVRGSAVWSATRRWPPEQTKHLKECLTSKETPQPQGDWTQQLEAKRRVEDAYNDTSDESRDVSEVPGEENQWCQQLELAKHCNVGSKLFESCMRAGSAARVSATCNFGVFIAPLVRESTHMHEDPAL